MWLRSNTGESWAVWRDTFRFIKSSSNYEKLHFMDLKWVGNRLFTNQLV
jgi:hypothetical protein